MKSARAVIAVLLTLILTLGIALPAAAATGVQNLTGIDGIEIKEDNASKDGGYIITVMGRTLYLDKNGIITDVYGRVIAVNALDKDGNLVFPSSLLSVILAEPPTKEVDGKQVVDTTGGYISDGKLYTDKECTQEYTGDFSGEVPTLYTKWIKVVEFDAESLLLALKGDWGNQTHLFPHFSDGFMRGAKDSWKILGGGGFTVKQLGNGFLVIADSVGGGYLIYINTATGAICVIPIKVVGFLNKPSESDDHTVIRGEQESNTTNTAPSYKCCKGCTENDCLCDTGLRCIYFGEPTCYEQCSESCLGCHPR